MKKITILALHLGYGGIEKYISSLCKMLINDYEIEIISTYKKEEQPVFDFDKRITIKYLINDTSNKDDLVYSVKHFKFFKMFKEFFKAIKILYLKYKRNKKIIKEIDTDYIITTRLFHNKLVSKYAKKEIIKIATDHNHHDGNKKYINKIVTSCNNFDYFIAISPSLFKTYNQAFKNVRCLYIPNVIDEMPTENSLLNNENLISIGRFSKEKGYLDLLDVIFLIKKEIPNIKLNLIGDGNERLNIENKIKELNLENNVILHGYLKQETIKEYMLESSIYIMTSYTESFGLVLLEAFSYGLPAIAFDSAIGAKELIGNNNGILIKNRDKEKMAEEVIKFLNDKEEILKYGINAKQEAIKYLSDNIKEKWLEILK